MSSFLSIIGRLFFYFVIVVLLADLITWAFTGTFPNTLASLASGLVTFLTDIPEIVLCFVQDLIYAVINIIIGLISSIFSTSLPSLTAPACP